MSVRLLLLNHGKVWRDLLLVLGLSIFLAVIAALWILTRRDDSASSFAWMYRHRLFLGGIAAFAAGVVVSRHRALQRADAVRSWLSALPVHPATARWEALAIETAPVVGAACVSTAAFCSVGVIAAFTAGLSEIELAATWFAIHTGVVLGALISYWVPAPTPIDLPPGSRYVPHRRVVGTSSPTPTLSALGHWPVRQMFASARPKAVARAVMPMLLLIPLGSSADTAMLVMALFIVLGALLLLVVATISVSKASCRWLQPLPLGAAALARALLLRPLAVILGAAAVAAWLFWVIGVPVSQSIMRGVLLLIVSSVIAAGGSLGAIYRTTKSRR
jgi:hypothetical protein